MSAWISGGWPPVSSLRQGEFRAAESLGARRRKCPTAIGAWPVPVLIAPRTSASRDPHQLTREIVDMDIVATQSAEWSGRHARLAKIVRSCRGSAALPGRRVRRRKRCAPRRSCRRVAPALRTARACNGRRAFRAQRRAILGARPAGIGDVIFQAGADADEPFPPASGKRRQA